MKSLTVWETILRLSLLTVCSMRVELKNKREIRIVIVLDSNGAYKVESHERIIYRAVKSDVNPTFDRCVYVCKIVKFLSVNICIPLLYVKKNRSEDRN